LESKIISDFVSQFADAELLMNFHGEVNEGRIGIILGEVEQKLENTEEDFKKQRKVYNILVEGLQNLYHHTDAMADGIDKENKTATFILGRKDNEYFVLTANYIEVNNIPPLKAKLDKIKSLDKDGLREYYKEVLDNGQYSVHGGGGLGMIDIARKSGNKLEYDFSTVNDDFGLYILKIKV
jgi:hypothetical protein